MMTLDSSLEFADTIDVPSSAIEPDVVLVVIPLKDLPGGWVWTGVDHFSYDISTRSNTRDISRQTGEELFHTDPDIVSQIEIYLPVDRHWLDAILET